MSTPIVSVQDVSKRFVIHKDKSVKERVLNAARSRQHRDDFWALKNVSFEIEIGSTVGLVGHNGSGKSTLLKAVGGIIEPTSGSIWRRGRLAALLELGAGFHADLSGRENVFLNAAILGLSREETTRKFDEIVAFSGIEEFIDTQVKFYSSGMYVRLAFAVAVNVDPDLLLVDEVLAVGDEPFQKKCMDKIADFQSEGRTIVLVSHSADQVGSLCDRVLVLDHGEVQHDGDTAEGLRVLRAGFDRARQSASAGSPVVGGLPRLLDVTTHADLIDSTGVLRAGANLTIHVDIDLDRAPEGWMAGIAIETPLGQPIYRVNTDGLGVELPRTAGRHRISFLLPELSLGGGQYQVNVGLAAKDGTTFDRRRPATSFFVEHDHQGAGVVRMDSSARYAPLDS